MDVSFDPTGGLNLSVPPHAILDNEMSSTYNTVYSPDNGKLVTRPSFRCYTKDPIPGGAGITNMIEFMGDVICSANNGKVYAYRTADSPPVFEEIHVMLSSGVTPSFLIFNEKLLIADGAGIYGFDGSAATEITTAIKPDSLSEVSNRVVANNTDELDEVWFSKPEDETGWDTAAEAISLRAGYGDGMSVNGLAVLGSDVFVSKVGRGRRMMYRINVSGPATEWKVMNLVSDTSANGPLLITGIPNNVVYINQDSELRGIAGIQEYGDLKMKNAGEKINPGLMTANESGYPPSMLKYLPSWDMTAIIFSGRVYAYYPAQERFTYFDSLTMGIRVNACCDYDNEPIWGADNGHIYTWGDGFSSDEVTWGNYKEYPSRIRSKTFHIPGEMVLKKSRLSFNHLAEGTGLLEVNGTVIKRFGIDVPGWFLFDANMDLADANMDLYTSDTKADVRTIRNKVRKKDWAFELRTEKGRIALIYVSGQFSLVNG